MPNKLTKYEYIERIAQSLSYEYGRSLCEYGTDVKLAKAIVKDLKEFLYFRQTTRAEYIAHLKWRKKRQDAT